MTDKIRAVVRAGAAMGLSLTLAFSTVPTYAFGATSSAEMQSELDQARAKLQEYSQQASERFSELEQAQANLEDTRAQISDTQSQIETKQSELTDAQTELSGIMSDNYKDDTNFVGYVLRSTSFDDLASRVYYANKVSEKETNAIAEVVKIQSELQEQKSKLEQEEKEEENLLEQSKASYEQIQSVISNQRSYVNNLSEEVRKQIEAEEAARKQAEEEAKRQAEAEAEAAEAARKQAEAEAAAAASRDNTGDESNSDAAADNGGSQRGDDSSSNERSNSNSGGNSDERQDSGSKRDSGSNSNSNSDGGSRSNKRSESKSSSNSGKSKSNSSSGSSGSSSRKSYGSGISAVIAAAKSQLGVSYSYAGNAIAGQEFDCSGLVWWAFRQAGYSIPRGQRMANGYNNSMIGWVMQHGLKTSISQLEPGDLMFWGSGTGSTTHVALYIGNGQMIHSNYGGVEIRSASYSSGHFVGGGSVI